MTTPFSQLARTLLVLTLTPALPAFADTIRGRVVDESGVGIANVNIDAEDMLTGDPVDVINGGTDASGNFDAQLPAGLYRLIFHPPAPPTTTLLAEVLEDVVVVGTINLGTIVLESGVALRGRVLAPGGAPLAGVDLDVIDLLSRERLRLTDDDTGLDGRFLIAVPARRIEVRFDTTPVGTSIAPTLRELVLSADLDMGDVQLEPGFVVTAVVRTTGGSPVPDADIDVEDQATDEKLFTPGDGTDVNGFVDFVVPAGTYDIEFCAKFADRLVPFEIQDRLITGTTNLGIVTLGPGVVLSGNVRSGAGTPIQRVDVNLFVSSTGQRQLTCNDDTDAAGLYRVIVPTGTFDVVWTPPYSEPFRTRVRTAVTVSGDRTLDTVLAACDCAVSAGTGLAGTGGLVPVISASGGYLRIGNPDWTVEVSNARGGATAFVFVAAGRVCPTASVGGTAFPKQLLLHPPLPLVLSGPAGAAGAGSGSVIAELPDDPAIVGLELVAIAVVRDAGVARGYSRTPHLCGTFCD